VQDFSRQRAVAASDGLGGSNADVSFAGAPESFTGLDQINIAIPRSWPGAAAWTLWREWTEKPQTS
jgi:uncharacterized protein (TIGR03437 family)